MPLVHVIIVLILVAFCAVSTTLVILTRRIKSLEGKFARVSANLDCFTLSLQKLNDSHRRQVASSRLLGDELVARMRDLRSRQLDQSEPSFSREPHDDTPERGESKESDSRRWEDSPEPSVSGVEIAGSEPTSNLNDQAVQVGEEILELLDVDGRTSRLSSIGGLTGWIKSTRDDCKPSPYQNERGYGCSPLSAGPRKNPES